MDISVVIPTYNRIATLQRCLDALSRQTLEPGRFEIVVVDDGSTDGTDSLIQSRPDVRYLRQPRNAGPAAARNRGVRAARGELVLFIGDDIIAQPELLAQHVAAHRQLGGESVAVLGYAPWSREQEITPLMRYLFEGRAFQQFRYDAIADPDNVPYGYFYTCNLSVKRAFLLSNGLFDEDFRYAYGEDTELAYRLQRRGLHLVFRQELVADHEHPTSYRSARRRTRTAGRVALLMASKHPELADLSFTRYGLKSRAANALKRRLTELVLDRALDLADRRRWDHPMLAAAYDWALRKHLLWGLLDTITERGWTSVPQTAARS